MHGRRIDIVENKFIIDGQVIKTRNGLDKNKCFRVSQAEKVVISRGVVAPGNMLAGILPAGSWMVEALHKSPRGMCVLVGSSLVEGGRGKVNFEMFNPPEEEVALNKNTHLAL